MNQHKRDEFAFKALNAILSSEVIRNRCAPVSIRENATLAYLYADAMIDARLETLPDIEEDAS